MLPFGLVCVLELQSLCDWHLYPLHIVLFYMNVCL